MAQFLDRAATGDSFIMWDASHPVPPVGEYFSFWQHLTLPPTQRQQLNTDGLLQKAKDFLETRSGPLSNYIIYDENMFLSFILGRLIFKHSLLVMAQKVHLSTLFLSELQIIWSRLNISSLPVPGVRLVKVQVIPRRRLGDMLDDNCQDKLKLKLLSLAQSHFLKLSSLEKGHFR